MDAGRSAAQPHARRSVNDGHEGNNDVQRAARARRGSSGRSPAGRRGPDQPPSRASSRALRARTVGAGRRSTPRWTVDGGAAGRWRVTQRPARGRGAQLGLGGDKDRRAGTARALWNVLTARARPGARKSGAAGGAQRGRRHPRAGAARGHQDGAGQVQVAGRDGPAHVRRREGRGGRLEE